MMVPWPIALLTLFYGAVAAASAATVWGICCGRSHQPLPWALAWLGFSASTMCGLPLFKSWARRLAVFGSILMVALILAIAALLAMHGHPIGALAATLASAIHVLIIRYLRRPVVRACFEAAESN